MNGPLLIHRAHPGIGTALLMLTLLVQVQVMELFGKYLKILPISVYNKVEDFIMPEKTIKDECYIHGNVDHAIECFGTKSQRTRCKKCRTEAVQRRRHKVKQMSIDYLGGKCNRCGYNKCSSALDFHHLNPKEKSFGIASNGHTRSWKKVKKELDKCELICANCHREEHHIELEKRVNIKICKICLCEFDAGLYNKMKYCTIKCRNKASSISRKKRRKKISEICKELVYRF